MSFRVAIVVACVALVQAQPPLCGWESEIGVFDLSPLMEFGLMGPVPDPAQAFYETTLAICTDETSETCNCLAGSTCTISGGSAMAVKASNSGGISSCLGAVSQWDDGNGAEWSFINSNSPNDGIVASFTNGDMCFGQVTFAPMEATIIFECDPSSEGDSFTVTSTNFNCDWEYTIRTMYACSPATLPGPGDDCWIGSPIVQSGIFDTDTITALQLYLVVHELMADESVSGAFDAVTIIALQRFLSDNGMEIVIDGVANEQTIFALQQFLVSQGHPLVADGFLGPYTIQALQVFLNIYRCDGYPVPLDCGTPECAKFEVGDRVTLIEDFPPLSAGAQGSVVCGDRLDGSLALVSFDAFFEGHSGLGYCACGTLNPQIDNRGFFVPCAELRTGLKEDEA